MRVRFIGLATTMALLSLAGCTDPPVKAVSLPPVTLVQAMNTTNG